VCKSGKILAAWDVQLLSVQIVFFAVNYIKNNTLWNTFIIYFST